MEKYVITISRQFGSLGRPIAKKLSELLNINFFDRDIVEEAAKKLNLPVSEISSLEEQEKKNFLYMRHPLGQSNTEIQEKIFDAETQIIMDIAARQSCVIVGRCSDYLLRNFENHLNFFIYAPYEKRLANCTDILNLSRKDAVRMIASVDKARNAYHKRYTHFKPDDLEYNHFMIDSSVFGIDGTAEIMAQIIRYKFKL